MGRILITGGAGFIGSHISLALLKKGYKIIILDSLVNSSFESIKRIKSENEGIFSNYSNNFEFIRGDLRNATLVNELFKDSSLTKSKQITSVIHCAGLKSIPESIKNPIQYWENNVIGSINLFNAMKVFECRTIVFSSSATIYGINEGSLLNEESFINPCNPYGTTKLVIEKLLHDIYINNNDDWRIANLRYFNPIGAHESGIIGEDPIGNANNIFPILTKVAIGKIPKLMIFGDDWPTKDGTGVRDYIHIMDLADGHVNVLEYLQKNFPQQINLNLGTGKGTSVLELIKKFQNINKVDIPYEFTGRRKGDYGFVVADNSLARNLLNWTPKRNIGDMCKDGWEWQRRNPNGYK